MKLEELEELHYIVPILNVPSILAKGILSYSKAKSVEHKSCASSGVQERRARVIVPGGRPLHDYVNLYFHARNPMMHVLKEQHMSLAVLGIVPDIIEQPGTIVCDRNAARDMALFRPALAGLELLDPELIYAEDWRHPNPIKYYEHQGIMCAEALVPDQVERHYIYRVYVSSNESKAELENVCGNALTGLSLVVDRHLFFQ